MLPVENHPVQSMHNLVPVNKAEDIFPNFRGTSVEMLLLYHNLGLPLPDTSGHAQMLVSMCMDHRKDLTIPNEFAYILRSAGGNLRDSEFEISYAIAVGGISTIVLFAHTDCGMVDVTHKRQLFVKGMMERGGWSLEAAETHFDRFAAQYQIGNAVEFVCEEALRLRILYPGVFVAPLLYEVETDRISQITEI